MRKLFRIPALILGAVATTLGLASCGGDDGDECCTYTETYEFEGVTYTSTGKACSDGTITYTDGDGETYSGSWKGYVDSWAEAKEILSAQGFDC